MVLDSGPHLEANTHGQGRGRGLVHATEERVLGTARTVVTAAGRLPEGVVEGTPIASALRSWVQVVSTAFLEKSLHNAVPSIGDDIDRDTLGMDDI